MKRDNPYRQGDSRELFDYIQKKQLVTKEECRQWLVNELGKTYRAACATTTTVLSPRRSSKRGDCRGNMSAEGQIYYMEKLGRTVRYGVKEPQRFRLRWREVVLERRWRKPVVRVRQEKRRVNVSAMKRRVKSLMFQLNALKKEVALVR